MKKISLMVIIILIIQVFIPILTMVVESDLTIKSIATDEEIIGTWDVSETDGVSNVQATLYSDGRFVVSGNGRMRDYQTPIGECPYGYRTVKHLIKYVIIEEGIEHIGDRAFHFKGEVYYNDVSNIQKVVLPEGLKSIGNNAFSSCSFLTEINFPSSLRNIGNQAFIHCDAIKQINLPNEITIGKNAFWYCNNLREIAMPENLGNIEDSFSRAEMKYVVDVDKEDTIEVDIPEIIIRAGTEGDVLYSNEIEFKFCELNQEETKLILNGNNLGLATITIKDGILKGFTIRFKRAHSLSYNWNHWTIYNVVATLNLPDGEEIINNDGMDYYIFKDNGEFTFKYKTLDNEIKEVPVIVDWIDRVPPIIERVEQTPEIWTDGEVILRIVAEDEGCGLADQAWYQAFGEYAYSFDGGNTWQLENYKVYTQEKENIRIKVRDKNGNVVEYGPISLKKTKLSVNIKSFKDIEKNDITYITQIQPQTIIKSLNNNIETNGIIEIYNGEEKVINTDLKTSTGMNVKISLNEEQKNYILAVTGDLNGDGNMDDIDLLKLARYKVGYADANLMGEYLLAADIVEDDVCADDIDLLKMARVLVDLDEL